MFVKYTHKLEMLMGILINHIYKWNKWFEEV